MRPCGLYQAVVQVQMYVCVCVCVCVYMGMCVHVRVCVIQLPSTVWPSDFSLSSSATVQQRSNESVYRYCRCNDQGQFSECVTLTRSRQSPCGDMPGE